MRFTLNGETFYPTPSCPAEFLSVAFDGKSTIAAKSDYERLLVRLCCRPDMEPIWTSLLAGGKDPSKVALIAVVGIIGRSLRFVYDIAFSRKTNDERVKWLSDIRRTSERLRSLLSEGPKLASDNVVGMIDAEGMAHFLGVFGVRMVDGRTSETYYDADIDRWVVSEWAVRRAQDGLSPPALTLGVVLDQLQLELSHGVPSTQTVKKPRDSKASRANYILDMTKVLHANGFHLTDELVAALAGVVLEDASVTPAIANRFRYRPNKDVSLGAIQHSRSKRGNAG